MTTLQLYFGPNSSYANLPHASDKNNPAIAIATINGKYLNMSVAVNNSGPEVLQVYVKLYSKVVDASMITDANINTAVSAALASTVPAVKSWDNVRISQQSTWNTGSFVYKLVGTESAYVLVATLTCQPLDEAPSLSAYTEDPCVAVWAAAF